MAELVNEESTAPSERLIGYHQLIALLDNSQFQERFVEVQTELQKEAIAQIEKKINDQATRLANDNIQIIAANALDLPVEKARMQGRSWRKAIVESKIIPVTNSAGTKISMWDSLLQKYHGQLEADTATQTLMQETQHALAEARDVQRQRIDLLYQEATRGADDPLLLRALGNWGVCPNANGETGPNHAGYNAGVIHFFEYRSNPNKNGRYRYDQTPLSLDGFIEYTNRLTAIVANPFPEDNPLVECCFAFKDTSGQIRLMVLGKDKTLIICFRRINQTGLPKIVTVLPGQEKNGVEVSVAKEKSGAPSSRLNVLGGPITDINQEEYLSLCSSHTPPK